MVAYVASTLLNPRAKAEVERILQGKTMVSVATWADQVRPDRPETAPYHHVDIPLRAQDYMPERDGAERLSLIAAIEKFKKVLSNPATSNFDREEALKFLIHLMGDLTQPLHCCDNDDSCGNRTFVNFHGKRMKLHHFWDYEIVANSGLNEREFGLKIRQMILKADVSSLQKGEVVDWALESHREAASYSYVLPSDLNLDDTHIQKYLPLVEIKLMKASVRLAKILNDTWP